MIVIAAALAVGGGVWSFWPRGDKVPPFRTAPVKRGDLVATISATGTLEPDAAVDVGAQVAGVIISFGKDKHGKDMNWGSEVEAGTVLAKIDDSLYVAAVKTAEGQLQQAEANVARGRGQCAPAEGKPPSRHAELGKGPEARALRRPRQERLRPVPGILTR